MNDMIEPTSALTIIETDAGEIATSGTALAVIPPASLPTLLAADTTDILGRLRAEIAGYVPDASTERGRDEIGSKARKVGTAFRDFERLADDQKKDHQKTIKNINAELAEIKTNCDMIRDAILAPRVAYLQIEKDRVAAHEAALAAIVDAATLPMEPSLRQIDDALENVEIATQRDWQEFGLRAQKAADETCHRLLALRSDVEHRLAEAAELARLRAEAAERDRLAAIEAQRLREEQIAAEAAEAAKVAAEAKAAREAEERAAAVLRAQQEAERKAQRADYHRRMLQHVKGCGLGFIDNQTYPLGILQHELTAKIKYDDENFGDLLPEALIARDEALARIQHSIDEATRRAQREEAAQTERDAAARREQEAAQALAAAAARERRAQEAAAQAEARANERRIAEHRAAIESLRRLAIPMEPPDPLPVINAKLKQLGDIFDNREWEEFAGEADVVFRASGSILALARDDAVALAAKQEAARIQAQHDRDEEARIVAEARARQDWAEKQEAERAAAEKRAANIANQRKVNGEVLADIIRAIPVGLVAGMADEPAQVIAKAVVTALAKGEIRHCRVEY